MSWKPFSSSDGHIHNNKATLDKFGESNGVPTFSGNAISGGTTNVTTTGPRLILGSTVRFSVDFVNKTISNTTFNLWNAYEQGYLSANTRTFTEMGSSTFYYVCYKHPDAIELISVSNIATYTGSIIFGIRENIVYPFVYPLNLIGVTGGKIYKRDDLSINEWTLIGDSLTNPGNWHTKVQEKLPIPKMNNIAVGGSRMAGDSTSAMWKKASETPVTTDLITIMGGTNDANWSHIDSPTSPNGRGELLPIGSTFDTYKYIGAYQYLIESLITKCPKAKIILFCPPRAWTDSTGTTLRSNLELVGDDVKKVGKLYGLPVIDCYNELGINELNQAQYFFDGLHWSDVFGKEKFANFVTAVIKRYY